MKKMINWILSEETFEKIAISASTGLLVLRIGVGAMMALSHGWVKLINYGTRSANFADPFGISGPLSLGLVVFAEFFCSIALAIGLLTRGAVIPLIITMLVAALVIHSDDPFGKKELALLFLTSYVTILIAGPGKYSLDRLITRK